MGRRHGPVPGSPVVLVASSAGGLEALLAVLPELPASFPAPVICVQHLHPEHPSHLLDILERRCALRVALVASGDVPQAGLIQLAPKDRHVLVRAGGKLELWDGPPVNYVRPSADVLFRSAAEALGSHVIAVVLTGSGADGAAGVRAVKEAGGVVVVQDPRTAAFPSMPEAAIRVAQVDHVVSLHAVAPMLMQLTAEAAA